MRGKQPKLKPSQEAHLVTLWRAGEHTSAELADLFGVARSTVYRAIKRAEPPEGRPRRLGPGTPERVASRRRLSYTRHAQGTSRGK
ncbi:MAG TPA: helix-turn-helix domain-containing protein [Kineosporiaceae bacterium]|nr:helix-turn-helix domain-containing protein [Kineosporiaceae bacterium]